MIGGNQRDAQSACLFHSDQAQGERVQGVDQVRLEVVNMPGHIEEGQPESQFGIEGEGTAGQTDDRHASVFRGTAFGREHDGLVTTPGQIVEKMTQGSVPALC